jgi:mono/diheme cytochrome c family protein
MRRFLKWLGITLGGLVAVVLCAAVVLSFVGGARLRRTRHIEPDALAIPTDSAALERGRHLVSAICSDCHGSDLTGAPVFEVPALGSVYAANITGLRTRFSDADLERAIRHGVAPDGRQLAIMPVDAFIYFSREDLGAIIAYLKTVDRTGTERPRPRLTFLGRAMYGAGVFSNLFGAETIDHRTPFPPMPQIGANLETGEYLTRFCYGCHGSDLHGGRSPDPDAPPAPNLAIVRGWSEDDFMTFSRTGRTPYGRQVDPQFMPWEFFGRLYPMERRALYLYLHANPEERLTRARSAAPTSRAP